MKKLFTIICVLFITSTPQVFSKDLGAQKAGSDSVKLTPPKYMKQTANKELKNIIFDFPNASLKSLAGFVAKLTNKILIGEEYLRGNVNIKSQRKMSLSEVKRLFRAILYSKNLDYVETPNCLEIVQATGAIVKVYPLKYLKAAQAAKALTEIYRMGFRVGNRQQVIQISSLDSANAVMVSAPQSQQLEIERSIKELDVKVRQILLDVLVVEVTKNDTFGFGAKGGFDNGKFSAGITNDLSKFGGKSPSIGYSFTESYKNGATWNISLDALDNDTKLKILSQPRVIATENKKSEIKVGRKQPYVNSATATISGGTGTDPASTSTTTATEDVGINIDITPRINNVKGVTMDLKLSITSIINNTTIPIGFTQGTNVVEQLIPVIGHRIVNNTSVVKDGETLVIGGLLDNVKTIRRESPPILGNIPLIGFLFAKSEEVMEQTELIVYITPTIIENHKQLKNLTKKETAKLKNYDPKEKETINQMLTGKKAKTDDVFSVFDYFTDGEYRDNQWFVEQI